MQVKLRALVEYLTDVVALNACSSALAGVQEIAAMSNNIGLALLLRSPSSNNSVQQTLLPFQT